MEMGECLAYNSLKVQCAVWWQPGTHWLT